MTDKRKHLVHWLRDAYAMEQQAVTMFEKTADRNEDYPEISTRYASHADESRHQAEQLKQCLKKLGEDTSALKTGFGKAVGAAQAFSGLFVSDEIVKGSVAGYAFEFFEIGNYKVLIAAAEAAGEPEIADTCRKILKEEEEMAQWMANHLPQVTNEFLYRDETGQRRSA